MLHFTNSDYAGDRNEIFQKILRAWEPRSAEDKRKHPVTETEWKHSLNSHLRSCLPDAEVNVERIAGRRQGDILVQFSGGWWGIDVKDVVEVKRANSLATGRNFDGLQTQIRDYLSDKQVHVFTVLCGGGLDEGYPRELKAKFDKPLNARLCIFWKTGFEKGNVRTIVMAKNW